MKNKQELLLLLEGTFRNISFHPELRLKNSVDDFMENLAYYIEKLESKDHSIDLINIFSKKLQEKFISWMQAKKNCVSVMITGGSNFPVNKARKSSDREYKKLTEYLKFPESFCARLSVIKTLSPEEEIENSYYQLDRLIIESETKKEINKLLRKSQSLDFLELNDKILTDLLDYGGSFPSYHLTSLRNSIKNHQNKILIMKNRIQVKNNFKEVLFDGGYWTIKDDRVKIFHNEKPKMEVIEKLKKNGFKWSPNWKCWCRKHTANAINVVKIIVK